MKKKSFIFFLLLFIPLISYSQPFDQETGEREKNYHVEHYKIEVKLDLQKKTVDGKVTTSIRSLVDPLSSFKVDAAGMNIKSVREVIYNETDKPELAESYENIKYDYDGKEITVMPSSRILKNYPYKYQVEYSTTDPEKGMYFISPDSIFPNKQYQVWTQGEGEDNHFWFPCYDYPNDKATTETIITVDKQYITLSNGVLLNVKDNKDGTRTWHWSLGEPHSSYLVMLAAGKFDTIVDRYDNIPVYTYVPEGKKDIAFKSFDRTADIVKFFSDFTGYKYPWHKFSQVVVEDFVYGGMENTGAVVLNDRAIYDDRALLDDNAIGLIAHELAHQWWGDVVTCKNWNEIWLNEGFATYFDALYQEHAFGKDEFGYKIYSNQQAALTADSLHRRPIYTNNGLTANTYNKGACVLDMLRYILGDEDFKKALYHYIKKFEFQNVTTENLIQSIKEGYIDPLMERGPRDLHWFFNEWIYKAGQPEYKVDYTYNDSAKQIFYTVQQVQRIDSSSVFEMPVNVEIITPKSRFTEIIYPDTSARTYIFTPDTVPLNVNFNKGNKVLCKLYYSKPKDQWIYQLTQSEDAIDRITAIKGLKDFINDEDVIGSLTNEMKNDKFWGVREESAEMLANSKSKEIPDIFMEQYKIENDSRIRRAILLGLGNYYNNCTECTEKESLVVFIINSINSELSFYAIADGIESLSKFADKEKLFDLLIPFENMDSHNEIIRRNLMDALIVSEDERAVDVFLRFAVHGRTFRLRGNALKGLENYLNEQKVIDVLNSLISTHNPSNKNSVIDLLKKADNPTSKPYLEAELKKTHDEGVQKALQEAIDAIK
jgi:aminopeptidase N